MKYSGQRQKDIGLHSISHCLFRCNNIRTAELAYILTAPEEQKLRRTTFSHGRHAYRTHN